MNNKERIIRKIGALVEKANLTEEDLAFFFANDDEGAKGSGDGNEQPKAEAQEGEKPESVESEPVKTDEDPEVKPTEDGKGDEEKPEAGQAVPEAKADEGEENSYQAITDRLEALSKALEALAAENHSLKQALKEANVLEVKGNEMPVGVDKSSAPDTKKDYEDLQSVIAMLNKGRG